MSVAKATDALIVTFGRMISSVSMDMPDFRL